MQNDLAPSGRDSPAELQRRIALVRSAPLLQLTIDALPILVMIINENRQALAANETLLQMLNVEADDIIGKRPGEVVGCAYWKDGPDGCGTTRHCLTCGAVQAILESQRKRSKATRECRLTLDEAFGGGSMDLRVTATAVTLKGERLVVCAIEDISREKRLGVLSRVFFHDVLNTAGAIQGYARLLAANVQVDTNGFQEHHRLSDLTDQLINEIESQRDLTLAESGDLEVDPVSVRTVEILQALLALYSSHSLVEGQHVRLVDVWDGRLITDARLLARVLGNMLKNALEATKAGGTVTVGCVNLGEQVAFSVHNEAVMSEEIRLQVFQRSFSTKAQTGRGIGTYSMRLLGEHYLGGKVEFSSKAPEGTTFTLTLPKVFSAPIRKP